MENLIESLKLELKREFTSSLDKEIVAFLNTKGGLILIGIDDDGTILGVSDDYKDDYAKRLNQLISNNIHPLCRNKVSYSFDDKNVMIIKILEGDHKPYYLKKNGLKPTGVYLRVGNTVQQAKREEILKLVRDFSGPTREDEECEKSDLHFKYLQIFLLNKGIEFNDEKYLTLGLINKEGKFTNLGYLFSDENEIEVKMAKYDKNLDFKFKREYKGSLCLIIQNVLDEVKLLNVTSAQIVKGRADRLEVRSYPEVALREAIMNAFCHADYSFPSNIKIEFFVDCARISNPGSIYKYSLDEVLQGQQSFRNPKVVRILMMLGFIENYGSGLKRIINSYKKEDKKVEMLNMANCFIVNLPKLNFNDENDLTVEENFKNKF